MFSKGYAMHEGRVAFVGNGVKVESSAFQPGCSEHNGDIQSSWMSTFVYILLGEVNLCRLYQILINVRPSH